MPQLINFCVIAKGGGRSKGSLSSQGNEEVNKIIYKYGFCFKCA